MDVIEAIRSGHTGPELEQAVLPAEHEAAHLRVEDAERMASMRVKDVRDSIHVGLVPVPEPGPDEVLIAVMASAINYNTVWSALFEPISTFVFLEQFARQGGWAVRHDQPYHVIGSDAAGIVVRTGVAVRRWRVGDRVVASPSWIDDQDPGAQMDGLMAEDGRAWGFETNFGGLAQFAIVKANQLLPKPPLLTWEEAACNSLCAVTAYRMLVSPNGARMKQGDVVLVWGATGGLGSYAVQFVRNGGGIPIGVVGSAAKERAARRLGCDVVVRRDLLGLDGMDDVEAGRALGRAIRAEVGEDPHIVFDYVGRATFAQSVFVARRGGVVVTCGSSTGYRHEYDNRHLWMRVKRIVGSHGANWQECWEANRLISMGSIVPALSRVHPLDEVGVAARAVQLNEHMGKVGILCLAEREGLGVEDAELRERVGVERLRPLRADADGVAGAAPVPVGEGGG
ncbi:MAG TPA: crotonyl-CoA carboxylase/reductase [Gaiella sp.]|nr:crotonyl-CoA carboxylase/reductase [Gaiella sp.]